MRVCQPVVSWGEWARLCEMLLTVLDVFEGRHPILVLGAAHGELANNKRLSALGVEDVVEARRDKPLGGVTDVLRVKGINHEIHPRQLFIGDLVTGYECLSRDERSRGGGRRIHGENGRGGWYAGSGRSEGAQEGDGGDNVSHHDRENVCVGE